MIEEKKRIVNDERKVEMKVEELKEEKRMRIEEDSKKRVKRSKENKRLKMKIEENGMEIIEEFWKFYFKMIEVWKDRIEILREKGMRKRNING